jgi:hypothetical protein
MSELVQKIAEPRTLDPNGWYIHLHNWIGWSYSKEHFCPFFWQTALACLLAPFLGLYRLFVYCAFKLAGAIGWCIAGMHKVVCALVPHRALNWMVVTAVSLARRISEAWALAEHRSLERQYGDQPEWAYYAANRADGLNRHSSHKVRAAYYKSATPLHPEVAEEENANYRVLDHENDPSAYRVGVSDMQERWKIIDEARAKATIKRQSIVGGLLLSAIAISTLVLIGNYVGSGTVLATISFVAKWLVIGGAVLGTIVVTIAGGPLIWGYVRDVVMQKYCPNIEWSEDADC